MDQDFYYKQTIFRSDFFLIFVTKIKHMFVQSNTVASIKQYFQERLRSMYTESEIRGIVHHAVKVRLNLTDADLLLANENRLSESDLLYFRGIVKRLQNHEPVQYVFGDTEFCGLLIKCDHRALIPRPETEELVEWIYSDWKRKNPVILDVCTGTGCIAFALKNLIPDADVSAVDVSNDALELADENKKLLGLQVKLKQVDVLSDIQHWGMVRETFDCWVSNPPYIPLVERERMEENVLGFEPEMALFVPDSDPLLFYRAIMQAGIYFLKPGGQLYLELHEDFADESLQLMQQTGYVQCELKNDLQGKTRMLKGTKK